MSQETPLHGSQAPVTPAFLPSPLEAWNSIPVVLALALGWAAGGPAGAIGTSLFVILVLAATGARRMPSDGTLWTETFRAEVGVSLGIGLAASLIMGLIASFLPVDGLGADLVMSSLGGMSTLLVLMLMAMGTEVIVIPIAIALCLLFCWGCLAVFGVHGYASSYAMMVDRPATDFLRDVWSPLAAAYDASLPSTETRLTEAGISFVVSLTAATGIWFLFRATQGVRKGVGKAVTLVAATLLVCTAGALALSVMQPSRSSSRTTAAGLRVVWGQTMLSACRGLRAEQAARVTDGMSSADVARAVREGDRVVAEAGC